MVTLRTFAALALTFAATAVRADDPAKDRSTFDRWVLDNLHCRRDFTDRVQDEAFLAKVRALGVKITSAEVGDLPEGEITLPAPVDFDGFPVTHIRYWADSGAEFYADVGAPADRVASALHAEPIAKKAKDAFDTRTVGAHFVRAAKKDELFAPAIFVRKAESGDASEVGCRRFDG